MRLGVVWEPCSNAIYRAIDPLKAVARLGHKVVWPPNDGRAELTRLTGCDVVHVYRRAAPDTQRVLIELTRRGTAITYDNDDDFTVVPQESPDYGKVGGRAGQQVHELTVKVGRMASVFTTTNEQLAEKYRGDGIGPIEIIGNYLTPDLHRPRLQHDGVVIGWVAGHDHMADVARIAIVDALQEVAATHPNVYVRTIGVDLALPIRYRFDSWVPWTDLPYHVGGFDIGIAPLADIPANWARSDIKLKEYAASGVAWLASPIGPYATLGEAHGGRLVPDEGWAQALHALVRRRRDRRRLSRNGLAWAEQQTVDVVAERWEQVFREAAANGPPRARPLSQAGRR